LTGRDAATSVREFEPGSVVSKPSFIIAIAVPLVAALAAAGCSDRSTGPQPVGSDVTLGAAEFQLFGGNQSGGPLRFPAAGPSGAEYLVVAQFATDTADVSAAFLLSGSVPAASAAIAARAAAAAPLPVALRFHDAVRRMDEQAALASLLPAARGPAAAPPAAAGPPALGSRRTFKVCGTIDCTTLVAVPATAQVVGAHSAIFVDDSVPAGGLAPADLQALGQQFDTDLYPIDHGAFGAESDIDANGVVLILLTRKVNALVTAAECQATSSFVTGFFLGADIATATRAQYNNGEVFYGMVPDPTGLVSCPHSIAEVKRLIPVTFIHEFQHMISFNQHVLMRSGTTEVLWLNEALSHLAEELGGWHYDSLGVDSTKSAFLIGDVYDAGLYLEDPAPQPMVTEELPGTLEARGAAWLFVRYLVDQFGPATIQKLEQTSLLGGANVVSATGTPFATLLGRWALALYVSDLPAFAPDPLLTYHTWRFRTTFASLHQQDPADFPRVFPLVPATAGGTFSLSGDVSSGSAVYLSLSLPAGSAAFSVTFTGAGGRSFPRGGNPQLAVVRVR
jgi:hypothetical protein